MLYKTLQDSFPHIHLVNFSFCFLSQFSSADKQSVDSPTTLCYFVSMFHSTAAAWSLVHKATLHLTACRGQTGSTRESGQCGWVDLWLKTLRCSATHSLGPGALEWTPSKISKSSVRGTSVRVSGDLWPVLNGHVMKRVDLWLVSIQAWKTVHTCMKDVDCPVKTWF